MIELQWSGRLFAAVLLVASWAPPLRAQTADADPAAASVFTPERIRAFANHLQERGDFRRAISEYHRYLFTGDSAHRPEVLYRIGLSHYELDENVHASERFMEAIRANPSGALGDSARFGYAASLLRGMDAAYPERAAGLRFRDRGMQLRLIEMTALHHLYQTDWDAAANALEQAPLNSAVGATNSPIRELLERGRSLSYKSPALAGALSAVVPGSGKLYAGRTHDALYSMALIGGTSWLAYRGFRDHGTASLSGWLFGTVGMVLYAGNVYGSVVAVRLYNAGNDNQFRTDVRAQIMAVTRL